MLRSQSLTLTLCTPRSFWSLLFENGKMYLERCFLEPILSVIIGSHVEVVYDVVRVEMIAVGADGQRDRTSC